MDTLIFLGVQLLIWLSVPFIWKFDKWTMGKGYKLLHKSPKWATVWETALFSAGLLAGFLIGGM